MIKQIAEVELTGEVIEDQDLSGLVIVDDYLLIGSDEGHALQLFLREGANQWRSQSSIQLADMKNETDLEAVDYENGFLYAIGSHSRRRRTLKPDRYTVKKNRKRFAHIDRQKSRNRLYRIPFHATGIFGEPESVSLSKYLKSDPIIGPFAKIPSKENGIDIEGLTISDGQIYLGFRGPLLRHNLVPVWLLEFDRPKNYQQIFVDLGGQGIRDIVSLKNGFLILSGPVSDAPGSFQLWWWDGADQLPGTDRTIQPAKLLGEISAPTGAKAEGMTLLSQSQTQAELLLVYDSTANGSCTHYRVDL